MRYTIRNINAWSVFKIGSVLGIILGFFPGFINGLLTKYVIHELRTWLESWQAILDLPLIGEFDLGLLDFVQLSDFLTQLQRWDDRGWLLVMLITLLVMLGGGLIAGLMGALGAGLYNLLSSFSGGVIVEATTLEQFDAVLPPPSVASSPPSDVEQYAPNPNMPAPTIPHARQPNNPTPANDQQAGGWLVSQTTHSRWPIKQGETKIGSGPSNQIVLDGVATHHATIRWENGRFVLYDHSNGYTIVNGRPLNGPNMIKSGFQIRLGNQDFLFQS